MSCCQARQCSTLTAISLTCACLEHIWPFGCSPPARNRLGAHPEGGVMKSQKIIVVLAGLRLCTTMGWTQNFGTTVQGAISAIPCPPPVPYYLQGKGDISSPPDYQQTCKTDNGSSFASASSQASLVTNEIANATTQNGGSAASNAEAIQTATLFPPKGFNGNSILVSYTDIYAMTLSG